MKALIKSIKRWNTINISEVQCFFCFNLLFILYQTLINLYDIINVEYIIYVMSG